MANVGGIVISKPTTAKAFTVKNLVLTTADTEYSYLLPTNTKYYILQCRGNAAVQFADSGNTGTEFWTIFPGQQMDCPSLASASLTLYFRSPKANQTVEIVSWQ